MLLPKVDASVLGIADDLMVGLSEGPSRGLEVDVRGPAAVLAFPLSSTGVEVDGKAMSCVLVAGKLVGRSLL